jgi:hypothetical protein
LRSLPGDSVASIKTRNSSPLGLSIRSIIRGAKSSIRTATATSRLSLPRLTTAPPSLKRRRLCHSPLARKAMRARQPPFSATAQAKPVLMATLISTGVRTCPSPKTSSSNRGCQSSKTRTLPKRRGSPHSPPPVIQGMRNKIWRRDSAVNRARSCTTTGNICHQHLTTTSWRTCLATINPRPLRGKSAVQFS